MKNSPLLIAVSDTEEPDAPEVPTIPEITTPTPTPTPEPTLQVPG